MNKLGSAAIALVLLAGPAFADSHGNGMSGMTGMQGMQGMMGMHGMNPMMTPVRVEGKEAEQLVVYRQQALKASGANMKAIMAVLEGELKLMHQISYQAQSIGNIMGMLPELFPVGTEEVGETKAKAEIWEEAAKFNKAARDSLMAAGQLAQAAQMGDMTSVKAGVQALGKTCKSCHDSFKADD